MKCIQWTPDAEPATVLWLIIGCKVTNKWAKYQIYLSIFERENSNLFAWLVQELRDIVSKVIILSERAKSIHLFLFWACSTLLNWLRHLLWHLPERCVLGYVLLPNICDVSHTLGTLTWVFSTPLVQEVYLGGNSSVVNGRISICPLSPTGMMLFCKSSADNGRFSNMLHHAS